MMKVVWDSPKASLNFNKHGIRFSDAETVPYDPNAVTIEDRDAGDEQRHVTIGADALGRVLVVVYTYRSENIRLISARRATKYERRAYGEGI